MKASSSASPDWRRRSRRGAPGFECQATAPFKTGRRSAERSGDDLQSESVSAPQRRAAVIRNAAGLGLDTPRDRTISISSEKVRFPCLNWVVQHENPKPATPEDLARCSALGCAGLGHHLYCGGNGTHIGGNGRI